MLLIQFTLFTIPWHLYSFLVFVEKGIVHFRSIPICLFQYASSNTGRKFSGLLDVF